MSERHLRVLVVGGGAVGTLYGWRLQESGTCTVSLVCRSNADVARARGLVLESRKYSGEFVFKPSGGVFESVHAAAAAAKESGELFDYVVVATKELPNKSSTADLIAPAVESGSREDAPIVLLQNGINIEEPMLARFPSHPVISCAVYCDCSQLDHGHFKHGVTARMVAGLRYHDPRTLPSRSDVDRHLAPLAAAFARGSVEFFVPRGVADDPSTHSDTIQAHRWAKLIWNASFNPVSAFAGGMDSHQIVGDPDLRELILAAMHEVLAIAQADTGLQQLPAHMGSVDPVTIADGTAARPSIIPSMMVDMQFKRPMERDVLLLNAIKTGEQYQIKTPVLKTLYALLSAIERTF